jgi:hypothetical protein
MLHKLSPNLGWRAMGEAALRTDVMRFVAEGAGDHLRLQRALQQLAVEPEWSSWSGPASVSSRDRCLAAAPRRRTPERRRFVPCPTARWLG